MTFSDIIPHLLNRGLATLNNIQVSIVCGHLCWCQNDASWRPYSPTQNDLMSTDWKKGLTLHQ